MANTISVIQNPLVYMGEKTQNGKNGNPFTVINFGDGENFQTLTFFKSNEVSTQGLVQGDQVKLTIGLEGQGFTTRTNLMRIDKVTK